MVLSLGHLIGVSSLGRLFLVFDMDNISVVAVIFSCISTLGDSFESIISSFRKSDLNAPLVSSYWTDPNSIN